MLFCFCFLKIAFNVLLCMHVFLFLFFRPLNVCFMICSAFLKIKKKKKEKNTPLNLEKVMGVGQTTLFYILMLFFFQAH